MQHVGRNLVKRVEHEGPLVHARVRQGQLRRRDDQVVVEQQVEVEGSRRVAHRAALAARVRFDLVEEREERLRWERGLEPRRRVQVARLRRSTDRRGLVTPRRLHECNLRRPVERPQRFVELGVSIPEIRPEPDVGGVPRGHVASLGQGAGATLRVVPPPPRHPTLPPQLVTAVPGPRSCALGDRLAEVESRNVTCFEPAPPIFWERAEGANVWDVDGNRYIDLTAGFGVANAGHAHPLVVAAVTGQSEQLLHAMGDVHPGEAKVALLEALAKRFPGGGRCKTVLGSSGSDAVEIALKTAQVATGRDGIVAFEGAYHGLTYGALDTTWRPLFRERFESALPKRTRFAKFGEVESVAAVTRGDEDAIGAVIVEPIQGRGGERIPPDGFLRQLRALCDERGWLLIADEVYTGCGRTGRWFACEHEGVVPDLLCVGKGLSSGMPLAACVGKAKVMDAWPPSGGEALHTQTFLGHPPACAAALASLAVIEDEKLVDRAAETGERALAFLRAKLDGVAGIVDVRGRGLLIGIECDGPAPVMRACARALEQGVILLPSGDRGEVLSITPPLPIESEALEAALAVVCAELGP